MNIAEKLTTIAENEQKVYNAGYEKGKAEGGGETEDFWGQFQNYGARTNYQYAFANTGFEVINPPYGFENLTNASQMCSGCKAEEIVIYNSKTASWDSAFFNCQNLLRIKGHIAFPPSTVTKYMCRACEKLKEFESLDVSELSIANTQFVEAFSLCSALEEIRFTGTISCNVKFSYSPNLSHDSLMSIINALTDYSEDTSGTTHKLTIGTTNVSKLTDEEKDTIYQKGWTYA